MMNAGQPPESDFTNDPIDVDGLPQLDDERFESLDPKYLTGSLAAFGIGIAVVASLSILIAVLVEVPAVPLVIGGGIVVLLLLAAGLTVLEIRRLGYQLRERDVSLRSGVLVHTVATVPFERVQHVRIQRGPFERLLGLASVEVNSAGPNISIPGLAALDAERIKQLITERAGVDDDGKDGVERTGEASTPLPDPFAPAPGTAWTAPDPSVRFDPPSTDR